MADGNLSPADIAAMTGDGMNGNTAFFWIFALLLLGGMGGNGWGGNGYRPQCATQDFVQNGFNFNDLQDQNRDIMNAITNGTAQTVAATNQSFHDNLTAMQSLYNELQRDAAANAVSIANLQANQNACCCETKQMVMQNNYDGAMRDAATNANFTAQIQSVKDMIAQNKIESLQAQVSQLQLAQATSGVVRYPNSWTFNAGQFPNCFCGGCNN